jgi:hypothetical protein
VRLLYDGLAAVGGSQPTQVQAGRNITVLVALPTMAAAGQLTGVPVGHVMRVLAEAVIQDLEGPGIARTSVTETRLAPRIARVSMNANAPASARLYQETTSLSTARLILDAAKTTNLNLIEPLRMSNGSIPACWERPSGKAETGGIAKRLSVPTYSICLISLSVGELTPFVLKPYQSTD